MTASVLAVDFGTSNSAAAMLDGGRPRRIPIEAGADTLPTAVFFPSEGGAMRIGEAAGAALIDGEPGRYMRALKSILGTALFGESRLIGGRRQTLADVVTAFLAELKRRAEVETGQRFTHALSGRPVQFHSERPDRNARAEADLRACYRAAGFEDVRFLFEPEAAARTRRGMGSDLGLIVDIGGGTSDFTVFRAGNTGLDVLASHGIRLGGTDFDREVSMTHAMPLLGHGGQLRRQFGEGLHAVPTAIYRELATWANIPFLYSRETEREVADLKRYAVEPDKIARLAEVIEHRLGHELAFAVERGKIDANTGAPDAAIPMAFVEPGLSAPITSGTLDAALQGFRTRLSEAMHETLTRADTPAERIGAVILVGGSSLMGLVTDTVAGICPGADVQQSEAFTAVVDGLALATAEAAFQD
ncbi:MAG: Hsp70 family protein [Pseudomonadota bacterium]